MRRPDRAPHIQVVTRGIQKSGPCKVCNDPNHGYVLTRNGDVLCGGMARLPTERELAKPAFMGFSVGSKDD